jgi:hypothetical protein
MKKPLLKVYITAPYYNPFDLIFVCNEKNLIIDNKNKEYKTNSFYKFIYESVDEIVFELNYRFKNKYKIIFYFNNKKIKQLEQN